MVSTRSKKAADIEAKSLPEYFVVGAIGIGFKNSVVGLVEIESRDAADIKDVSLVNR